MQRLATIRLMHLVVVVVVVVVLMMMILTLMMQRDAVEVDERICYLTTWSSEARVHRNTLQSAGTNVDTCTLLQIAEIDRIEGPPLVRYHRWFHVSQQCPGDRFEKRVAFDI